MHWCMEGCSFQPFLKLCFLVKWLIFSQRWNLAFYNDEYKNTCHPQIILKLTKVKIFKNSNTLFKRMSALSHVYVFIFPTCPSCSLKHSNRHQYSINLQKIWSGRKLTPYKWRHHSRWHEREQMKYAMLRQQPLLRVQVAASFKKKKTPFFFFWKKEIQSIYSLEKQTQG